MDDLKYLERMDDLSSGHQPTYPSYLQYLVKRVNMPQVKITMDFGAAANVYETILELSE